MFSNTGQSIRHYHSPKILNCPKSITVNHRITFISWLLAQVAKQSLSVTRISQCFVTNASLQLQFQRSTTQTQLFRVMSTFNGSE